MLDLIRQQSQSWGVKLLFGLIVLVFVFWGVGSFNSKSANILATVNERTITIQNFLQEYEKRLETFRQQRPNVSSEEIRTMHFKQQVLDSMINQELLSELAAKYDIRVSDVELRDAILHMPVFLNKDKQFDKDRYTSLLQANRMDPAQFETGYAHDLTVQKVQDYLTLAGTIDEKEVKDFFRFAREQARIDYILYNQDQFTDQVKPAEKDITAYYDAHKETFAVPAKMKIAYLLLSPDTLADRQDIPEEKIDAYYAAHTKNFQQEAMVKARHILIKLAEDASKEAEARAKKTMATVLAKYRQGTSFEELAKKYSQGPSGIDGGDLGWFARGRMEPTFEKAAFDLEKGQVSDPVRTPFGYHLILVEDRKAEGLKPLEEVRNDIRHILAREQAENVIQDTLDQALELVVTGDGLEKAAQALGLNLQDTDFFTQADGPRDIKIPSEAVATLFDLQDKEVTQAPILLEDGYLLAQRMEKEPAHTRALEKVRGRIVTALKEEGAQAIALEKAKKDLALILKDPARADTLFGSQIKRSETFGRQGFIPNLVMQPKLVEQAFAADTNTWMNDAYPVTNGVVLAKLNARILPSDEDWNKEKTYWSASLEQVRKQEMFMALVQTLRQQATIKILNQRVLED